MGKTKFNSNWQQNHPWLVPVKNKIYVGRCTVCDSELSTESGVGGIKRHEQRETHIMNVKKVKDPSQATFSTSN